MFGDACKYVTVSARNGSHFFSCEQMGRDKLDKAITQFLEDPKMGKFIINDEILYQRKKKLNMLTNQSSIARNLKFNGNFKL